MFVSRLIELFLATKHQLNCDEELAVSLLHQRDRQFALSAKLKGSELSVREKLRYLRSWVTSLQPKLVESLRLSSFLTSSFVVVIALICGGGYATAILSYDGTRPLNLLLTFVLLVAIPSFFSFLSFYPLPVSYTHLTLPTTPYV